MHSQEYQEMFSAESFFFNMKILSTTRHVRLDLGHNRTGQCIKLPLQVGIQYFWLIKDWNFLFKSNFPMKYLLSQHETYRFGSPFWATEPHSWQRGQHLSDLRWEHNFWIKRQKFEMKVSRFWDCYEKKDLEWLQCIVISSQVPTNLLKSKVWVILYNKALLDEFKESNGKE